MKKFAVAVVALVANVPVTAVDFKVNLTVDMTDADPGDGVCNIMAIWVPDAALCSLRAAIQEANATPDNSNPVNILLEPGKTYQLSIPGAFEQMSASGDLDIHRPMRIGVPEGAAGKATIDAGQTDRALQFLPTAGKSAVYGVEIVNGLAVSNGLAIYSQAPLLSLDFVDVHDNASTNEDYFSGAVHVAAGTFRLRDSRIHRNFDAAGEGAPWPRISGLFIDGSVSASVERSLLDHNGMAGIRAGNGVQLVVSNSTAAYNGRWGLVGTFSAVSVLNSTLAFNDGRQLQWQDNNTGDTPLEVVASVVAGGDQACFLVSNYDTNFTAAFNVYGDNSCGFMSDDGSVVAPPALEPFDDWGGPTATMPPKPSSTAVNHVPALFCSGTKDQRGLPRIKSVESMQELRCDAGAVELQSLPSNLIFADGFSDG